jgi:hypothetical protein
MPKSIARLNLAEQYDREAEQHVRKAIEWKNEAVNAATPADREKFGEKARLERNAAIESLKEANIAFGPEIREAAQDSDAGE